MDLLFKDAPRRCAASVWLIAALAACAGAACSGETPAAAPVGAGSGTLEFAVGPRVQRFGLLDATCEPVEREEGSYLLIMAPAASTPSSHTQPNPPNILVAQLPLELQADGLQVDGASVPETGFGPADSRYGANASALNVEFDGEVYAMVQLIAQRARDMPEYQCRVSREGAQIELICNDALVFPWRNVGEVPSGSFRAVFQCAADAQK